MSSCSGSLFVLGSSWLRTAFWRSTRKMNGASSETSLHSTRGTVHASEASRLASSCVSSGGDETRSLQNVHDAPRADGGENKDTNTRAVPESSFFLSHVDAGRTFATAACSCCVPAHCSILTVCFKWRRHRGAGRGDSSGAGVAKASACHRHAAKHRRTNLKLAIMGCQRSIFQWEGPHLKSDAERP